MIAFGGGGPVHACRVAEKIGAERIIVPPGAGVGSAIGFLRAPVGYEVVRSRYARLGRFDGPAADDLLAAMATDAAAVVEPGRFGAPTRTVRTAFMRYVGQGHEIPVRLTDGPLDAAALRLAFDAAYARFYDRPVPGSDVEVMSYAVSVATEVAVQIDPAPPTRPVEPPPLAARAGPGQRRDHRLAGARPQRDATRHGDCRPRDHRGGRNVHTGRGGLVGPDRRPRPDRINAQATSFSPLPTGEGRGEA